MKLTRFVLPFALALAATSSYAVNVLVAPSSGPVTTIQAAIGQVNAGADANNVITLRSTEGVHNLTDNEVWTINAGKNVSFVAESGQPIVKLNWLSGQFMLRITIGATGATETVSFNGIAFIPETGLTWANNIGDAFQLNFGNFVFNNCVFSANNGSDGVASQDASAAYSASAANIGDDWLQMVGQTNLTLSNCAMSGTHDDGIVVVTAAAATRTILINQGTTISNIGGSGIQVASDDTAVILDGSAGRVQLARNGQATNSQGSDTAIKFFWDAGCSLSMTKADVLEATNAGIFDFEGATPMSITDSRIAMNNTRDIATAGNFSVDDVSADSAYPSAISIIRSTLHDALGIANPTSIYHSDGAAEPVPAWTITDSIFSGAGDTYDLLNGTGGTVNKTFSAVVTAGPHTVASPGDLGAGTVSADPQYVSTTYTIGKSATNPDFLLPSNVAYNTANSTGGQLRGGAPGATSVNDSLLY